LPLCSFRSLKCSFYVDKCLFPFPKFCRNIPNFVPLSPLLSRLQSFTILLYRQKKDYLPDLANQKGWKKMLSLHTIHDGVSALAMRATGFVIGDVHVSGAPNCSDPFVTTLISGLGVVINILMALGVAIAVIGIIVGGLMRATAWGSEQRIATSNKAITCAVIGLVIVLLGVTLGGSIPGWFGASKCTLLGS
jgi:hypothetical protein